LGRRHVFRCSFSSSTVPSSPTNRDTASSDDLTNNNGSSPQQDGQDKSLAYVSYEKNEKVNKSPVVLHHGLFGRKENLVTCGKALHHLTKRRIVIPDARNHGNSFTSASMSIKQMSDDLKSLLQQLNISRTTLLGHGGMGGRVAMMTALTAPDIIDRLIVVSATPINTDVIIKRFELLRQACYVIKTLSSTQSIDNEKDILTFKMDADDALKELLPQEQERGLFLKGIDSTNYSAILDNPDLGKFPSLELTTDKPVLFVKGSKCSQSWTTDDEIRKIRQFFPNASFAEIPDCGQSPHVEKFEQFLEIVAPFLESETGKMEDSFGD